MRAELPLPEGPAQEAEDGPAPPVVSGGAEAGQPVGPPERLLSAVEKIEVLLRELDEAVEEEVQLLQRPDATPPDELHGLPLKGAGRLVEQRLAEYALVREAPVEGALADAGPARDLLHRYARHPALLEERPGGAQDGPPVARRVTALRPPERR